MVRKLSDYAEIIEEKKGKGYEEIFPDIKETKKEALLDMTFTIKDVVFSDSTKYPDTTFVTMLIEVDGEQAKFTTSAKAIVDSLQIKEIETAIKKEGLQVTLKTKISNINQKYWIIE